MNTRAQIKTDPVSTNTEFRAQVEARKEQAEEQHAQIQANVEMRQANREERRANFALEVRARLDTIAEKITTHFDTLVTRFEEANTRIEAHITRLEENDIDTTSAFDAYADAQASLEVTKEVIVQAEIDLNTALEAEEVSREEIHTIIETVRASIQETKQAYVDVLVALRASVTTQ